MKVKVTFQNLNLPTWLRSTFVLLLAAALSAEAGVELETVDVRRDATVLAVEQVMPSVVNIATRTRVRDPFERLQLRMLGQSDSEISLGSGVIIDEAGYLLTNEHVVQDVDQIGVQLNVGTNVYYEATVVAKDPRRDVALLKLKAKPGEKFHAIKFAREDDLLLGETVLAMGNPYGLGGTVTRGILSSKSRNLPTEGMQLGIPNWLQTDAPINKGNSGGPLVNLRGELIGINVATLNIVGREPAQGLGFAIPIKLVEEALADILPTEYVKSFWFGARVKVGTSPLVVTTVQPDSPAGRAGLKTGDMILEVDGKAPKSFIDFADLLAARTNVTLAFQRGAERRQVSLQLVPVESVFNADAIRRKVGLTLETRTLQVPGGTLKTLMISGVEKGSPADTAQLRNGTFVMGVDDQSPEDLTTVAKLLYAKKTGESVQLHLLTLQQQGNFGVSIQTWSADLPVR